MTECDVTLDSYDGDDAGMWITHEPKARVDHKCSECGGVIPAGSRYERIAGRYPRHGWDVWRLCLACSEIQREFSDGPRVLGCMWDTFADAWDDGANLQACLNRVHSVSAKQKLAMMWRANKGF
jgi:hypothetical protein